MEKHSKIFVAGHLGLAGSAIVRELKSQGFHQVLTKTREELDLLHQEKVNAFFRKEKCEYSTICYILESNFKEIYTVLS